MKAMTSIVRVMRFAVGCGVCGAVIAVSASCGGGGGGGAATAVAAAGPVAAVVDEVYESPAAAATVSVAAGAYKVVDTGQAVCYSDSAAVSCPGSGVFFGQDAQYSGVAPAYRDNGDGTVSDLNTGLMWQKNPGSKMTFDQAVAGAGSFRLGGYSDWRLPGIKELYSLIKFNGTDPSGLTGSDTSGLTPFIDTSYFTFKYGDPAAGDRIIDSQYVSSNVYVGEGFDARTVFGVNFADGRIKGYGTTVGGREKTFYVMYVRGGAGYGVNKFEDGGSGAVTDRATGLVWTKGDSGRGMVWKDALSYCENLTAGGRSDWRLPNAKELQSIVDYSRAPSKTGSAAIDAVFSVTAIKNEGGQVDYPYFWTSTTHAGSLGGWNAAYISFGRALGYIGGGWNDVHGAGAQRSDPKSGDPSAYPYGHGPQGDAIRIYNYVRCVAGGATVSRAAGESVPVKTGTSGAGVAGPPQKAFDACVSKQAGAVCSFSSPRGTIRGKCGYGKETKLICLP